MGQPKRRGSGHKRDWELDLIRATAREIVTTDRDELEGVLAEHLLYLKSQPNIQKPKGFFITGLRNKALNWVRDQQTRRKYFTSFDRPARGDEETGPWVENIASPNPEPDPENRILLAAIYGVLDSAQKILLDAYLEAEENLTRTGNLLGISRNTVSARLRAIRGILASRGLTLDNSGGQEVARVADPEMLPASKRLAHLAIPASLLKRWLIKRLSGTQWRILMWMMLETARRKRRTIGFRWTEIAGVLSIHPTLALEAGKGLIRDRHIRAADGKLHIVRQ